MKLNIFFLDGNPALAAKYHNKKHCSKMILETAQMQSTNLRLLLGTPQTVWTRFHNPKKRTVRVLPKDRITYNDAGEPCLWKWNAYVYLESYQNHPCTVWARESKANWDWLNSLGKELYEEKLRRTGQRHASYGVIKKCMQADVLGCSFPYGVMTMPALAMPEHCQVDTGNPFDDAVASYRNYYMQEKRHLAEWPKTPDWWK